MELPESIARDGATLISKTGQGVDFLCKCGAKHRKRAAAICNTSGAFCKDCTERNTSIKRIRNKITFISSLLADAGPTQSTQ